MTTVSNDRPAACPVCKQWDRSTFFMCKEGFDLYKCDECQHIFVWPIPSIEALKRVYSFANPYQVQDRKIFDENTDFSEKMRESLKQMENFCPSRGRLLEYALSLPGKFLWLARRNGWSVCGVELQHGHFSNRHQRMASTSLSASLLLQTTHFLPLTQFTLAISSSMFEIQLMCFLGYMNFSNQTA